MGKAARLYLLLPPQNHNNIICKLLRKPIDICTPIDFSQPLLLTSNTRKIVILKIVQKMARCRFGKNSTGLDRNLPEFYYKVEISAGTFKKT